MEILKLMILFCLSAYSPISADQINRCNPMRVCNDFQGMADPGNTNDINDTEIASTHHMSGLKPESYQLMLHFENTTQYMGSINITVKVVHKTNRFAVHMDKDNIEYNAFRTVIHHDCTFPNTMFNCLEKAGYDNKKRLLLLWLKQEVLVGSRLTFELKGFSGFVYNSRVGVGSIALNRINHHDVEAIHTNFFTKLASTVFPCFDNPSLKVKIQLCLEYPKYYTVASTAQKLGDATFIGSEHRRQCFKDTPVIPVYVFAFAVMRNYTEWVYYSDTIEIGTFVPNSIDDSFRVLENKLRDALLSVRQITKTDLPFRRISVLLLHIDQTPTASQIADNKAVAMENAGLISLYVHHSTNIQWQKYHGGHFYRAIAHQWIGAGFTVSHWGEICLQQGLAEYLEWILWQHHENITIHSTVASIPRQVINKHPPMSYTLANYPAEHRPGCEYRAALVFHMVAEVFELVSMKEYVANLSKTFVYSNANMDIWDETLAQHTDAKTMTDYIRSWFMRPTPIILWIRYSNNALVFNQIENYNSNGSRPIPMRIYTSNSEWSTTDVLRTAVTRHLFIEKPNWTIVDPNNALLAVKCYDSGLYMHTLAAMSLTDRRNVSSEWRQNYLDSFCNAVLSDKLPLPADVDTGSWLDVFKLAYSYKTRCDCCLVPAVLRPEPRCHTEMGNHCDRIGIIGMLGYNASI